MMCLCVSFFFSSSLSLSLSSLFFYRENAQKIAGYLQKISLASMIKHLRAQESSWVAPTDNDASPSGFTLSGGDPMRVYTITLDFFEKEKYPKEQQNISWSMIVNAVENQFSKLLRASIFKELRSKNTGNSGDFGGGSGGGGADSVLIVEDGVNVEGEGEEEEKKMNEALRKVYV